jgi:predicted RNase H-like HicB family nuclease
MRVKVVFEVSDEGGYTVYVPGLPGCISEGDTVEEARGNILEAIALYLEPDDDPSAIGAIPVEHPPGRAGSFVEEISI